MGKGRKPRVEVTPEMRYEAFLSWQAGESAAGIAGKIGVAEATVYPMTRMWRAGLIEMPPGKVMAPVVERLPDPKGRPVKIVRMEPLDRSRLTTHATTRERGQRTIDMLIENAEMYAEQLRNDAREQLGNGGRLEGADTAVAGTLRGLVSTAKELIIAFEKMGVEDESADSAKRILKQADRIRKLKDGDELDSEFALLKEQLRLVEAE